jgi:hypothetical protein
MRKLICAALLCAASIAHADYVATNDAGSELRLMNGVCDNEAVLDHLKPEYHSQFRQATATVKGKTYKACWIAMPEDDAVYVQYEEGDGRVFPVQMFKEQGA